MPSGLPGNADRDRDQVPAAPAGAGGCHPPGDQGLIAADLFCCLGDRPQVGQILGGYAGRVEVVCQLLESVGGGLYPVYPHDGDQVPFDLDSTR